MVKDYTQIVSDLKDGIKQVSDQVVTVRQYREKASFIGGTSTTQNANNLSDLVEATNQINKLFSVLDDATNSLEQAPRNLNNFFSRS